MRDEIKLRRDAASGEIIVTEGESRLFAGFPAMQSHADAKKAIRNLRIARLTANDPADVWAVFELLQS